MTSAAASILAAAIVASPAWGAIVLNARMQRKRDQKQAAATDKQTTEIKDHITAAAAALSTTGPAPRTPDPEGAEA